MINLEAIKAEISNAIGADKVRDDIVTLVAYSRDWSPRPAEELILPNLVVRPETTEEVAAVVKICNKYRIPVVPVGGMTGMGGGTLTFYGGVVIDTKGLNKILEIDKENLTVTAQAGITIKALNDELSKYGLWLPHDPESKPTSTLGAAIACDNDSTFGVRWGKMLDHVLSAVVVTGSGEIIRVGNRKAYCSSSGLKLHALLVGSEGTLGVITEVTLRVLPIPEYRWVDGALFKSIKDAVNAAQKLLSSGLPVDAININDRFRLQFYTHAYRVKYGREPKVPEETQAILFFSMSGDKELVDFAKDHARKIIEKFGGQIIEEREIIESWWKSKHTLDFDPFKQKWPDSQRSRKFGAADVGVPPGRLEDLHREFVRAVEKHGLKILGMNIYNERIGCISPSVSCAVYVGDSEDEVKRFYEYVKEMSRIAIDLEGTASTYIGDTWRLLDVMEYEHGRALEYMRKIKEIFDPNWIMNPGKKFVLPRDIEEKYRGLRC
ncbi:MAG: FAD-binding oxidoreductase [Crenarchaeota archaeon]|nr:FAD-binding oxidoreductase [Thermoproteota archaeon]MCR8455436.1 FAD-binding oxidoreductase [Thermoproteota archaeon]MCR8501449.1 FAD-binding oxidoreductase [Thermoproteota archaeon]